MKKKNRISRRTFLALAGTSGAAIALKPGEKYIHKLIPYVNAPVYPKPGEWAFYLSTCRECPAGCGMMLWHRDGRVTKAEGNPENPINRGKLCIRGQSSVLGEYDPDRISGVMRKTGEGEFTGSSWEEALPKIRENLNKSGKLLLISDLQTGSLAEVMNSFASEFNTTPLFYEAFNYESLRRANMELYGKPVIPRYKLNGCDLIISFGADFLETWLSPVEYAHSFSEIHTVQNKKTGKLIYFGPSRSMTAANSDEFILTDPASGTEIIYGLIRRLGGNPGSSESFPVDDTLSDEMNRHLDRIAEEISKARKPIVLAGRPEDKSLSGKNAVKAADQLNRLIGNASNISFTESHALSNTVFMDQFQDSLEGITGETTVVIHNTNPVFSEPGVEKYLEKASEVIFIGSKKNETSLYADWVLPGSYPLEEWGDYEAWKGTVSLIQPAMKPIYDSRSSGDIFLELSNSRINKNFRELVRENWKKWAGNNTGNMSEESKSEQENNLAEEDVFRDLGQKAFLFSDTYEFIPVSNPENSFSGITPRINDNEFYLRISASHFFYDGRLANRGWLQEIPHPVSNIVWHSWIDMNHKKADQMGLGNGDIIKLVSSAGSVEVPVRLTEMISENTLAMDAGQGHTFFGELATGRGVNVFSLIERKWDALPVVKVEKTGKNQEMLFLNATKNQHDRELLQHVKLKALRSGSVKAEEMNWPLPKGYKPEQDLYKGHEHEDHRWAMVIDLQKCIGCKACEAACYAENNIPVVGEENSREGREMSWLKVLPYEIERGKLAYLPLPCQHCDSAPCEPVCPVYASVHTEEGLNAQIYNRCIGTRYCSNNCPYKVRRFNWINISHDFPVNLQLNPEVTVRQRGVMEKCTFCVQRIRSKEYQAKIEKRKLKDGEITPACAQTCPTGAIRFGDLMNEDSEILSLIDDDRRYQLLNELNTKTAVVYLKKVTF